MRLALYDGIQESKLSTIMDSVILEQDIRDLSGVPPTPTPPAYLNVLVKIYPNASVVWISCFLYSVMFVLMSCWFVVTEHHATARRAVRQFGAQQSCWLRDGYTENLYS